MKKIRGFAPATIANLTVGYDILGLSLASIGDEIELQPNNAKTNRIIYQSDPNLPIDIHKNCCAVVIDAMQKALDIDLFVDISIFKGFKSGSGLGSSSASSAVAAFTFNELLGQPFKKEELVYFSMQGEQSACGVAHADNVAPAIMGGITLVFNNGTLQILNLPVPNDLYAVVVYQNINIKTADSRNLVPDQIATNLSVQQTSMMGAFVHALHTENYELIKNCMKDNIAEPKRKSLITNYIRLENTAKNHDVLAFGISGSGPSVYCLCRGKEQASILLDEYRSFFKGGEDCLIFMEKIDTQTHCKLL